MIIGKDKKDLQKQREQKYNEYAMLLNSKNPSKDDLNALKSEIKYLDDQINKIIGSNEKERLEQVKNKKSGIEEKIKLEYDNLKGNCKKISPMLLATNRIIKIINNYQKQEYIEEKIMKKVV